jgi:hypothetical protein
MYNAALIALTIYFIYIAYIDARTSSFVSLDPEAGVCKEDHSSDTCCEVPQSITGTFSADSNGRWNTQSGFSFTKSSYKVTALGLEYTTDEWSRLIKKVTNQLSEIGKKGQFRDFAW